MDWMVSIFSVFRVARLGHRTDRRHRLALPKRDRRLCFGNAGSRLHGDTVVMGSAWREEKYETI